MSHWGYVMEQIVQGDARTRDAQRLHQQRRAAARGRLRWWLAKLRDDQRPVPPAAESIGSLTSPTCARAADLAKGAVA
jgi:hypothetical protein